MYRNDKIPVKLLFLIVGLVMVAIGYYFSFATAQRVDIHYGEPVGTKIVYDDLYDVETKQTYQANEREVVLVRLADGYDYAVEYDNIYGWSWYLAPVTHRLVYTFSNDFKLYTVMALWVIAGSILVLYEIISVAFIECLKASSNVDEIS